MRLQFAPGLSWPSCMLEKIYHEANLSHDAWHVQLPCCLWYKIMPVSIYNMLNPPYYTNSVYNPTVVSSQPNGLSSKLLS